MEQQEIMIVDDAAFMRKLIRRTLEKRGLTQVVEAENGRRAVELYPEHKEALVLMDVTMPEMSGIEALKEIRALNPAAKVIMCSAVGQEQVVMEAIRSGALDFVVKPFQEENFLDVITGVLGEEAELL